MRYPLYSTAGAGGSSVAPTPHPPASLQYLVVERGLASNTVEAYFALKLAGHAPTLPSMRGITDRLSRACGGMSTAPALGLLGEGEL